MTFKDLSINQRFIFASENEYPHSGMATGPWYKLSSRTYTKDTSPFNADGEHSFWNDHHCTVGTINVTVIPI
jgi:hypothetical protein